jgi:hypothetical protein
MDAQEGTFTVVESRPYDLPGGEDAYLTHVTWRDEEGYFLWAYDLEIVSGDSNIYFFLSGDGEQYITEYGDLLDSIAGSFEHK